MSSFKQTWWDTYLPTRFDEFNSWIGDYESTTKKYSRDYVMNHKYTNLVDFGCGVCSDYLGYKKYNYDINYTGVDNSTYLYNHNQHENVNILLEDVNKTSLLDNSNQVSYSRHVTEHQETWQPLFDEMIRVASVCVVNVFFIPPQQEEIINFDKNQNIYHNTYSKPEINKYLKNHPKVKSWKWKQFTKENEEILFINLK